MKYFSVKLLTLLILLTGGWCYSQSDQNLEYFTYFGDEGSESCYDAVVTELGEIIVVGNTSSTSGITTENAHQSVYGGGEDDGLITKWDEDGNLIWATYFGGSGYDNIVGIDMLSNGNFVVAGSTASVDNISTPNAFQEDPGGSSITYSSFLSVFDVNGQVVWSTYFGGVSNTRGDAVCVDSDDNIYLISSTGNQGLATPGAHQTENGFSSPVITKFNNDGARLWSTYFGSAELDKVHNAEVDHEDNLVLLGTTWSTEGLATSGAQQESGQGERSMFLCKFSGEGSLLWSTYISGEDNEYGHAALCITSTNEIILTGYTRSTTGIATPGAPLETNEAFLGNSALFMARYDANGYKNWGTYFGEGGLNGTFQGETDIHYKAPHFYLTTRTNEGTGIIFGETPFQAGFGGFSDILLAKFHESGNVIWSTYFGGNGGENRAYLQTHPNGQLVLAGNTSSDEFYANNNSYQEDHMGSFDFFLAYFSDNVVSAQHIFQKGEAFTLYPNPGSENFHLTWDDLSIPNAVDIGIYDLQGRILFEENGYQKEQVINPILPSGNYLLRINSENRTHTLKLIKSE